MDKIINQTPRPPWLTLCRKPQNMGVHIQDHFLVHNNPLEPSKTLLLEPNGNIKTPHENLLVEHMLNQNYPIFYNISQQQQFRPLQTM
jgi:hypothetical protein